MKFVDPDGRESEYFNYNNYVKGRLFGEANVISAGIQNLVGEIGNFASNIIKGNGLLNLIMMFPFLLAI